MFCYQCQETAKNQGCTKVGVCGKSDQVACLQDLLIYTLKGLSVVAEKTKTIQIESDQVDEFIMNSLFKTITNANFDSTVFVKTIKEAITLRESLQDQLFKKSSKLSSTMPDCAIWTAKDEAAIIEKSRTVSVLNTKNDDIRSLRELLTYGVKGIAAYAHHAAVLGRKNKNIFSFMKKALIATTDDSLAKDELIGLIMECGKNGVEVMTLLDEANTSTYGHPEITEVNIRVKTNPGILISGHDLKDMEELLKQTDGTGVDVYTHSEMLPAHYYPAFKKYRHFVGNYGSSWWKQKEEFASFNGPILLTTNCLVPPDKSYIDRVYTTGPAGFTGVKHLEPDKNGKKDFSILINHAKKCLPPKELEKGSIIGGFAHNTIMANADKIVAAIKNGSIKRFFVMAGCDGRMKSREYYTEFAKALPKDTVILTAGCAKYRYNKLHLGDIGGIPRVLDAGQCNDSYSLAFVALKLKEAFNLKDINELPISYNIAWYEQKAVIVLLGLLYLGVKNIKLGPTLPGFLSPNVAKVLVDTFGISVTSEVNTDLRSFLG